MGKSSINGLFSMAMLVLASLPKGFFARALATTSAGGTCWAGGAPRSGRDGGASGETPNNMGHLYIYIYIYI